MLEHAQIIYRSGNINGHEIFNPFVAVNVSNENDEMLDTLNNYVANASEHEDTSFKFSNEARPSVNFSGDFTANNMMPILKCVTDLDEIMPELSKKNFVIFTAKDAFEEEHKVIIHKSNLPLLHMLLKKEPYKECRTPDGDLEANANVIEGIKFLIHDSFEYLKLLDLLRIEYGKKAHETTLQQFLLERAEYIRCITGNPFDEDTGMRVYITEIKGIEVTFLNHTVVTKKEDIPFDKPIMHLGYNKFAIYAISKEDAIAAYNSL